MRHGMLKLFQRMPIFLRMWSPQSSEVADLYFSLKVTEAASIPHSIDASMMASL